MGTWEEQLLALFDDLEGQATALFAAEREAEVAERTRAEYREVTLAARVMASVGRSVAVEVAGLGRVEAELRRATQTWCLLGDDRQEWVVPLAAVLALSGVSERALPEVAWSPVDRLGLGSALRRLAESGAPCLVHLRSGPRRDGVLRRVGGDFLELTAAGDRLELVPFAALAAVQSRE